VGDARDSGNRRWRVPSEAAGGDCRGVIALYDTARTQLQTPERLPLTVGRLIDTLAIDRRFRSLNLCGLDAGPTSASYTFAVRASYDDALAMQDVDELGDGRIFGKTPKEIRRFDRVGWSWNFLRPYAPRALIGAWNESL
jgi:hypothetical protein